MKKSVITLFLAVVSGDPPMSPCPRFKRKTVKALSPTLGIAGESPQYSEDLQRKARPEGERPNNHPQNCF